MRNVIFSSDDRGADYLTIAVHSLLKRVAPAQPLTVNVLAGLGGFSPEHTARLEKVVANYPFAKLAWLDVDTAIKPFAHKLRPMAIGNCRWNILTWSAFFAPDLIPDATGNAVYFDVDTLIADDISPLFDLDLQGNVLAAVYEDERGDHGAGLWRNGIMPEEADFYFNSGLIVFDLAGFRREHGLERMVDWFDRNRNRAICLDQDALNAVFWDKTLPLPMRWNYADGWVTRHRRYSMSQVRWRGQKPKDVLEAIVNPAVLHFWGMKKPWDAGCRPERKRYHEAMQELGMVVPRDPLTARFRDLWYAWSRRSAVRRLSLIEKNS